MTNPLIEEIKTAFRQELREALAEVQRDDEQWTTREVMARFKIGKKRALKLMKNSRTIYPEIGNGLRVWKKSFLEFIEKNFAKEGYDPSKSRQRKKAA